MESSKGINKRVSSPEVSEKKNSRREIDFPLFRSVKEIQEDDKTQDLIDNGIEVLAKDSFLRTYLISLYEANSTIIESAYGINNSWIIKPTGVSRGSGIKIETEPHKITCNKYGKIIQKYIEKPLLLKCGRKFDIRQWVLVRSFIPLEAYVFKRCYCRFSYEPYQAEKFDRLGMHLTNYSRQK